jgi:hypothetical protein
MIVEGVDWFPIWVNDVHDVVAASRSRPGLASQTSLEVRSVYDISLLVYKHLDSLNLHKIHNTDLLTNQLCCPK